jgi:hypothetical protein
MPIEARVTEDGAAGRVVGSREDLATGLAECFLGNAGAGRHSVNDELVAALRAWTRDRPEPGDGAAR